MTVYTGSNEKFKLDNPCTNLASGSWQQFGTVISVTRNDSVVKGPNYPDWRERLRQSKQCTTTLTGLRYKEKKTEGFVTHTLTGTGCNTLAIRTRHSRGDLLKPQNRYESDFTPPSALTILTDNGAKRCVVNKLTGEFTSGVFIGELGKTLRMIRDPARTFRQALDKYRDRVRGLRGSSRAIAKGLADAWLTTAYGVKPLIADIEDANHALNKIAQNRGSRKRFTCAFSDSLTGSTEGPFNADLSGVSIDYWYCRDYYHTTVYRGVMRLESDSTITLARHLLGFTPEQFVPTVYELIPYSFLVDYFTNIGDIINAWSVGTSKLRWASKTTIAEMKIHFGRSYAFRPTAYMSSHSVQAPPYNHWTVRKVSRAPYSGNFIPNFRWEVPGIGSTKWLNIGALAAMRIL